MSSASDFLDDEVLDHVLAVASYTAPSNVYVQLHTGAPGDAGTANPAGETARMEATFAAASGGSADLSATVTWTSVASTETVSHWSLWDASTGGNCLLVGALNASVDLTAGDNLDLTSLVITAD